MKLKLTRNIGREDLQKYGLVKSTDAKDVTEALAKYAEGTTHDFDKETGDALVSRGLAGADDGVPGPQPMRGVSNAPTIAKAEDFSANPNQPGPKKDK